MLITPLHILDYLWVFPMVGIALVATIYVWLKAPSTVELEQRKERDDSAA